MIVLEKFLCCSHRKFPLLSMMLGNDAISFIWDVRIISFVLALSCIIEEGKFFREPGSRNQQTRSILFLYYSILFLLIVSRLYQRIHTQRRDKSVSL